MAMRTDCVVLPFSLQAVFDTLSMAPEDVQALSMVLLVGSFAEGLHSSTSDVDLVFIGDKPMASVPPGGFAVCQVEGRRVEAWCLPTGEFDQYLVITDQPSYRGSSLRQLELCHKLLNGICLVGRIAHEVRVAHRREPFRMRMSDYFSQSGEGVFKDILGAVESEDFVTAAVQAREIVGFAADAYLAARGDTYPKRKWRARRIIALRGTAREIVDEYAAIEFGGLNVFDENQTRAWIDRCLRLVRRFQLNQYFARDDGAAMHAAVPPTELFYIYRAGDRFVIRTRSRLLQLPITAALDVLSANTTRLAQLGLISEVRVSRKQ